MYFPVDGPAVNDGVTVTDTPQELKVDTVVLDGRKVVMIQAIDGDVYWGFDNTVSASSGFKIFRTQLIFLEAGDKLPIWIVAETGETVDARIGELG